MYWFCVMKSHFFKCLPVPWLNKLSFNRQQLNQLISQLLNHLIYQLAEQLTYFMLTAKVNKTEILRFCST